MSINTNGYRCDINLEKVNINKKYKLKWCFVYLKRILIHLFFVIIVELNNMCVALLNCKINQEGFLLVAVPNLKYSKRA